MNFNKKVLKNGLRILTVPMKDNPTVTVLVLVEAGSKYEVKENNGISHFLEHMCFKGTNKRPSALEITKELDSIGAQYNAFTGQECTGYYAKADYKNFDKILDVVSDMYVDPILPESEIEKEKGVIIEEINMHEDLPQRKVWDVMFELLYGDVPVGWSITGPKENIKNAKRADFIDYRMRHYVSEATTIIVAGKIKEKEVIEKVKKAFNKISDRKKEDKKKVAENQKEPQIKIHYKDTDQTHIIVGSRTYNTYNKYNPIIRVMSAVLSGGMSSRLFQRMRDQLGICYYVRAGNETFTDHGFFAVSAGVDSTRVKEAIKAILEELKRVATETVSKEELEKVKQYLIGSLHLGLESSDAVADFYGEQEIFHKEMKNPDDIVKEINAVKAEDIKLMAERIFKNEGLNMAIVGKFKDDKEFKEILRF